MYTGLSSTIYFALVTNAWYIPPVRCFTQRTACAASDSLYLRDGPAIQLSVLSLVLARRRQKATRFGSEHIAGRKANLVSD
jgi:hypothetical protein